MNRLDDRIGIRLLALDARLPGLRTGHGSVVERVLIPPGTYRYTAEMPTIGMANLLVGTPGLPREVAETVVRLLVRRAAHLVPEQALGTQFLDVRTLIGTGAIPLHAGARAAYRDLHG